MSFSWSKKKALVLLEKKREQNDLVMQFDIVGTTYGFSSGSPCWDIFMSAPASASSSQITPPARRLLLHMLVPSLIFLTLRGNFFASFHHVLLSIKRLDMQNPSVIVTFSNLWWWLYGSPSSHGCFSLVIFLNLLKPLVASTVCFFRGSIPSFEHRESTGSALCASNSCLHLKFDICIESIFK